MLSYGDPPYLECSSRGDRRFSAFYACPSSLSGASIESAYQALKRFPDGSTGLSWRAAKGRRATNMAECAAAYRRWWEDWVIEAELGPVLLSASGLSDTFGQRGHVCQAETLWQIRATLLSIS